MHIFDNANDIVFVDNERTFKKAIKASTYFDATSVPSIRLVYKGNLIWEHRWLTLEPISRHMLEGIIKARQVATASN